MSSTAWTRPMREALRWPERLTVSEWADRHRVLDPQTSAEPGPWRTVRVPWAREWMDSAALPWVHQVTIQKSTQVAGTETLLNVLGYAIHQDPGPITYVMPSREDAEAFGENRVLPMLRASPALAGQLTEDRHDMKRRRVKFRRCTLHLRTARVPSELAQLAARWLFGDECNKWPEWTQKEAGPWELALERTRTFWNHTAYLTSTPTIANGLVTREFQKGDQRRFYLPCPHCEHRQFLRFPQIKWPAEIDTEEEMRARRDAWYECEECGERIGDLEKAGMLARGFWCPKDVDWRDHLVDGRVILPQDRAPHRSYHLWAGYSPWLAWWEIAAKFLRSKGDPAQLQNFVNSWQGEAWQEKVDEPKPAMLEQCRGGYVRGQVPEDVLAITVGADVQKRYIPYVVRGWGTGQRSWLLDHGRASDFGSLAESVLRRPWGPKSLRVRMLLIDGRFRHAEAVELARTWGPVVRLSKGVELDDITKPWTLHRIDRHPETNAPLPQSVVVAHVNVHAIKDEVALAIRRGGADEPRAFRIYDDIDADYLTELTAEHKVIVRTRDKQRERWVPKAGAKQNHFWDCEVLAAAAAKMLGIEMLRHAGTRPPRPPRPAAGGEEGGPRLWRRTT